MRGGGRDDDDLILILAALSSVGELCLKCYICVNYGSILAESCHEVLSLYDLFCQLYSFCGSRSTRKLRICVLLQLSPDLVCSWAQIMELLLSTRCTSNLICFLSHSPPLIFLPIPGCWHMVCVPQLIHWRLSWASTRDQGRTHSPGDFL